MSTPAFLIVGAMKSGTTTLYQDLVAHPDLCLPEAKEPEILVKYAEPDAVRDAYAAHFRAATEGQQRGEASTAYTKRPVHDGVAEKAREICGPDLKVIYMRRDPVERAISHYRHDRQHGLVSEPFDEAVRHHSRFIDFGRYDWQIAPWVEAFGEDQVLQIELDSYSRDRAHELWRVLAFLGVDPARLKGVDPEAIANSAGEQKFMANPLLRAFVYSGFYQNRLKPLIPRSWRQRARRAILPSAHDETIEVSAETRAFILESVQLPPHG